MNPDMDVRLPKIPPAIEQGESADFTIDWVDLKSFAQAAMRGQNLGLRPRNAEVFEHLTNPVSWNGFDRGQVERWMKSGYDAAPIQGLGEAAPVRERRRFIMAEEGDEISIPDALGGEEYFMIKPTKRETVPGVSLDVIVTFASTTPAEVVNAYNAWVCRTAYSFDISGIDAEITLNFSVMRSIQGIPGRTNTRVRVKKSGELIDFVSISPMLSPAAFRGFLFSACALHAESRGMNAASGLGHGDDSQLFGVKYNPSTKKIEVKSQRLNAKVFPEARMTAELKQALKDSRFSG
jgi:hypothetical protein